MENLNPFTEYYPFHDVQLILYGQEDCLPSHSFGPYVRDIHLFHFITKGKGTFCINQKSYTLQTGDAFFIPPGVLTYYEADALVPWHYSWIGLRGIALPRFMNLCGFSKSSPVFHFSEKLFHLLETVFHKAGSTGFDSPETIGYVYLFLNELLACGHKVTAPSTMPNQYIATAIKHINQNIYKPISVSNLSKMLGIDRSYFCQLFKKHLGTSPSEYILTLKLEKAKFFLETNDVDIRYIAESLGYDDIYTFSHLFKRKVGVSPREWRNQHKKY